MIFPSQDEFIRLSKKGNLIPVYKEILADLETPVSALMKITDGDYAYLLESVEGEARVARYSFLATGPQLVFRSKGRNVEIINTRSNSTKRIVAKDDPLCEIKRIMARYKLVSVKGLPRFCGGLVGYIGYDTVRFFENIPDKNPDDLHLYDIMLMLTDNLVIFDHVNHKIKIIANVFLDRADLGREGLKKKYREALRTIEAMAQKFQTVTLAAREKKTVALKLKVSSNFSKSQFKKIVQRAKAYIRSGDIIQAVLSQRLHFSLSGEPFNVYRALRSVNPSPYMYYLKFKDVVLVGSSPELLVRCEDGVVQTRPIAGTRPRGANEQQDKKLEAELLQDAKEKAEHIMLVDLGRNDLGRVCKSATVTVNEFMAVEKYSHVMHLVSNVTGRLLPGKDAYDVIRAAFPAGTVSGAPKVRAMEIIDELENTRRGPYAGAIAYFSFSGNMDSCITIRTVVIKGDDAYLQAGAGIVLDSVPQREYDETMNKARALLYAVELSQKSFK